MTNTFNEPTVDRLRNISSALGELRAAASRAEDLRDNLVRELWATGNHSAINLGKVTGATRGRIYQIIDALPADADDEDYAEFAERFENAIEHAVDGYISAGLEGSIDDFFPLDLLLRNRA